MLKHLTQEMYQNSSHRKQQGNLSMIIVVLNNEMVVYYIYIFTYIDTWVLCQWSRTGVVCFKSVEIHEHYLLNHFL